MLTEQQKERLYKQQYRLVGNHSVVKVCFWTKECVREKNKVCYKEHFYDIHCGNCLEMSPAITCNQRCLHCWRDTSVFSSGWTEEIDDPKEIIQGCIEARRKLMIGFKGNENVDLVKFENYLIPDHAAISLTGEPCMYPRLPELVDSFFDDFNFRTVFLVTNGTMPEVLKKFGKDSKHFPTNLYMSLEAFDSDSYQKFNNPVSTDTWNNIQESMKYLSTIKDKTKTILRITAVKKFNMEKAKEFVKFIELMQPTHIEIKGYGFLGYSRKRMQEENVPEWNEVIDFSKELAELTGYSITEEHEPSTVIQLSVL
ncbi:4-demethylwyosine synthase TYW1 [Candidatus Woesearchaeota archaeon]|jgi:tRNA wybutosine-synthesizing protein 1|nr:4-demethylwyosine synthase TYW1 [Candidatus Woesearchaeota archaeon]MBT6774285.1 4-demethylwyosine synthase TYW1 [Candidatus Woesearchaeota archaeon]